MSVLSRFLMEGVEVPLLPVVADLEEAGYAVDVAHFRALRERFGAEQAAVTARLREAAGTDFNPASSDQVAELLYDRLGLPVARRTQTGKRGVREEDLRALPTVSEEATSAVALVLRHRRLDKLLGTYCSIPDKVGPDGRFHPEYNQLGAETGRFTSRSVIQTPPRDGASGVRDGFVAAPGRRIVAADFDQQELVLLAALSRDEALLDAVRAGVDLHGLAAVRVFGLGCDPNEVKTRFPAERGRIKAIQFGIIYGKSAAALAADLKLSREGAEALVKGYFESFPGVKTLVEKAHEQARREGVVVDVFGRRRPLPEARYRRPRKSFDRLSPGEKDALRRAGHALRAAQNFVIQGAAATVTKLAMLACHRHLRDHPEDGRMVLTLHDELHFEVPQARVAPFAALLPGLMTGLGLGRFGIDVPLHVSVKEGPSWGGLRPYDPEGGQDAQEQSQ
jgi:DNA polymerase-1